MGWQHWCKSDLKDCGQFTMEGRLPGALHQTRTKRRMSSWYVFGQHVRNLSCHAAGTHELAPANMTNQWHSAW
jgi:hypothetical protein